MAVAAETYDYQVAEAGTVDGQMALDAGTCGGLAGRLIDEWLAERVLGEPVWATVPVEDPEPTVSQIWWQTSSCQDVLDVKVLVSSELAWELREHGHTCDESEMLEAIGDAAVIRLRPDSVAIVACERDWLIALKLTRSPLWPGDIGTLTILMDDALRRLTATAAGRLR
jgi:hypothetical protein